MQRIFYSLIALMVFPITAPIPVHDEPSFQIRHRSRDQFGIRDTQAPQEDVELHQGKRVPKEQRSGRHSLHQRKVRVIIVIFRL